MKNSSIPDSAGNDIVAGETPFHSLLQTSVPKDFVIQQRDMGETICWNFPVVSSDDD